MKITSTNLVAYLQFLKNKKLVENDVDPSKVSVYESLTDVQVRTFLGKLYAKYGITREEEERFLKPVEENNFFGSIYEENKDQESEVEPFEIPPVKPRDWEVPPSKAMDRDGTVIPNTENQNFRKTPVNTVPSTAKRGFLGGWKRTTLIFFLVGSLVISMVYYQGLGNVYALTDNIGVRNVPSSKEGSRVSGGLYMYSNWYKSKENKVSAKIVRGGKEDGFYKISMGRFPFWDFLMGNYVYVSEAYVTESKEKHLIYQEIFKDIKFNYKLRADINYSMKTLIYYLLEEENLGDYTVKLQGCGKSNYYYGYDKKTEEFSLILFLRDSYKLVIADRSLGIKQVTDITFEEKQDFDFFGLLKPDRKSLEEGTFSGEGQYIKWTSCDGATTARAPKSDLSHFLYQ